MRTPQVMALILAAAACDHTPLAPLDDAGADATAALDGAPQDGPASPPPYDGGKTGENVLEHHAAPSRAGVYVQPLLSRAAARGLRRDVAFRGMIRGSVYAQPLYVEDGPSGRGAILQVTETNDVYALDETTGDAIWHVNVGTPADMTGAACGGKINPLGITGTPYVDLASRALFFDAVLGDAAGGIRTHLVHALSIDDGREKSGWPVDVGGLTSNGHTFDPRVQNQRGGLSLVAGTLYVPYGAHAGDCGDYHGWIVAVPLADPSKRHAWATPAAAAGIWAPSGLSSDGVSLFAATGNSGAGAGTWSGGEAIVRLSLALDFSGLPADYFAPSNWRALDAVDQDVGGSGALLVDVPGAAPSKLAVALGKDGVAYVVDRANMGGVADPDAGAEAGTPGVAIAQVMTRDIVNAPATYTTSAGTFIAMHGQVGAQGTACPAGQSGDLVAIKLTASSPPKIVTAWCQDTLGHGSPIVTTTDGRAESIVWIAGAGGSERLHGWNAETGALVYEGGGDAELLHDLHRFATLIAVKGRLIVAGHGEVFAFRL